jgi:signal transduction histidine kinase
VTEPAEQQRSAPSRTASDGGLLEAVARLPWLAPAGGSLTALARGPSAPHWSRLLRHDPGAVLLLVRAAFGARPSDFPAAFLDSPTPLESALRHLCAPPCGFVDWSAPAVRPVYAASRAIAQLAHALALRSGAVHAEQAWVAGLLAPLGWLAACAVVPDQVAGCLAGPRFTGDPLGTQHRHLGVEASCLARRLARVWRLPDWLAGVVGAVELPLAQARRLGADPGLFAVVRLAADLAREAGHDLGLVHGTDLDDEERFLGLSRTVARGVDAPEGGLGPQTWDDPYRLPLLCDLLAVAAEAARLRQTDIVARLERDVDALHATLRQQTCGAAAQLQEAKLSALAEFAAGAGHEINNPLAVISGQAQYLLGHDDWLAADAAGGARLALQTIIAQTKRVHGLLRDLMQFARPAPARLGLLDLPTLLGEVAAALEEVAGQKQVRVEVSARPERLAVHVDGEQLRQALTCLLRNAIEAAGSGGWVRLRLDEDSPADRTLLFVEDSGPGPTPEQRPHLFDPFYSGRCAGRGRGLGLPLAWRLARQQGGDVHLEPARPGMPTRFVLALPRRAAEVTRDAA